MTKRLPNPELARTGWFKHHWGPSGQVPVEMLGQLETGEWVYFRARGSLAQLRIARTEDDAVLKDGETLAHYKQEVVSDHPLCAGVMEVDACVALIKRWLQEYFACSQSGV